MTFTKKVLTPPSKGQGMLVIKELHIPGYRKVIEAINEDANLHCFIAIHDTRLGPSLGGTRIYPYSTREEALKDALRLSKAMTYKSALTENGLGGGKGVIIANPHKDKTQKLLEAYAEVVHSLKGEYITAEDVGSSFEDMLIIKKKTPFVVGMPEGTSSGDPSPFTARGVFKGIQAVAYTLWGSNCLKNKTIAIQGLGNVGGKLAQMLFWEGANLILCDVHSEKTHHLANHLGAQVVSPEHFFSQKCDILSPCALGGVINDETISQLHCSAIAGGANNQLKDEESGVKLHKKGILYAPDYVINAGGILNVTTELEPGGYNPKKSLEKIERIYDTLLEIFKRSKDENKPTHQIADEMAENKLEHQIGKRKIPIKFE